MELWILVYLMTTWDAQQRYAIRIIDHNMDICQQDIHFFIITS